MMKGLSLCQKFGALFLVLAVCVLAVGCGGSQVDALIKEEKAIDDEIASSKSDPEKLKAAMAKRAAFGEKIGKLSKADQEEYLKRKLSDAFKK
jgi:hypothetical protein